MAVLRMDSYDRNVALPDLCMQCGAPATLRKNKTFSWYPPWVWIVLFVCNILIFAIVAMIMTKRRTVDVPLCEEHKHHWMWRQLLILGTLGGVLLVGVVAFTLSSDNNGGDNPLGGFLCAGALILLVLWIILAVIVQSTSIRPKEITDRSITLSGVSTEFVEAYKQEWQVAPERLDAVARERWNQGGRAPRPGRPAVENPDRIQPAEEDEGRKAPPDTFQEGTP